MPTSIDYPFRPFSQIKTSNMYVQVDPQARFGANRWDTAEFGTEQEKSKFLKLVVSCS